MSKKEVEEKIDKGYVVSRVRALNERKNKLIEQLNEVQEDLENTEKDLELAYEMMDYPHRFKLYRVIEE